MPHFPAPIVSRLPAVGTTIFTIMSRLAQECGAINLSQGFPDFSAEDVLFERVAHWMRAGHNQYAPMAGVPTLRAAIVAKVEALYGAAYDPEHEVTVTAGATQALFTAVAALVHPGDEVIVFEPVYDSYVPAIELQGGVVRRARLSAPDYRPDWQAVRALVTPRTRMIMINTPHNPTGTVWTAADLAELAAITRGTGIVVVADEVQLSARTDVGLLHAVQSLRQLLPAQVQPEYRLPRVEITDVPAYGWRGLSLDAAPGTRTEGAARMSLLTPDREAGLLYAAVTVRDHGPGMAREHLPRLTERFYRVEGQKSGGERPGTGLGLAIVKHIINRHRGGLVVESAPGEGAAFTAYFPMRVAPKLLENVAFADQLAP